MGSFIGRWLTKRRHGRPWPLRRAHDSCQPAAGRSRRRRSSWALKATTMVDTLMATAPSAIGMSMPYGTSRPIATEMATTL